MKMNHVMPQIRLIHWNQIEAEQKAEILRSAGYRVSCEQITPEALKELKNNPPDAIVVDLTRLPMQGRDIAINIRHTKATRDVPIIFVGGDPEKIARIKTQLPDATYAEFEHILTTLREVLAHPPSVTIVPTSIFDQYRDTPLEKKLGIRQNIKIALQSPPQGFIETLGKLPQGATISESIKEKPDVIIWFTRSRKDLETNIVKMVNALSLTSKLWIAWPKQKAPEIITDLTQTLVREAGLAHGVVDYKICAIDRTWSALLFAKRKIKGGPKSL
jgi:CheY-like chemotaxis protein